MWPIISPLLRHGLNEIVQEREFFRGSARLSSLHGLCVFGRLDAPGKRAGTGFDTVPFSALVHATIQ